MALRKIDFLEPAFIPLEKRTGLKYNNRALFPKG
jgi:hypothetical protein